MTNNNNDKQRPLSFLLGASLLWAMAVCGSAVVVFSILTNKLGVPPALCTSWRLIWVQILQLLPFCLSIRQLQRETKEAELVQHWVNEGTALIIEGETHSTRTNRVDKNGIENQHDGSERNTSAILSRVPQALPLLSLSGVCLGVHFVSWVYSLRMTSLTHSLLWVSIGPILSKKVSNSSISASALRSARFTVAPAP